VQEDALPRLKATVPEQSLPRCQARDRQALAHREVDVAQQPCELACLATYSAVFGVKFPIVVGSEDSHGAPVPFDSWILPPYLSLGVREHGTVSIRGIRRDLLYGSGAKCFFCPAGTSRYLGRRLFLTIIRRRLPFQS
jgi:hypothetical protein